MGCMKTEMQRVVLAGLDGRLAALRAARVNAAKPARGWLRAVREALGLAQGGVAEKLAVTRQAYADYEAAEARGTITLNSLQRAAEAMECELVYFLVPRETVAASYRELAQRHDPAFKRLRASEHSMALEDQAVGDLPPAKP